MASEGARGWVKVTEVGESQGKARDAQVDSFMLRHRSEEIAAERSLISPTTSANATYTGSDLNPVRTAARRRPSDRVFKASREFSTLYLVAKRSLDFVLAIIMLVALLPLILIIAIVIRTGGSSVVFRHSRVGKSGQLFDCYKFRTMELNAQKELAKILQDDPEKRREWLKSHKLENDPRITRLGRFLRKSSLDELPQFLNVIRGDMSLVGPRPIVVDELAKYGGYADHYLSVKPGLTGLWQISGRNNTSYHRRVALDAAYVRNASLGLDLSILLRTCLPVLSRNGARLVANGLLVASVAGIVSGCAVQSPLPRGQLAYALIPPSDAVQAPTRYLLGANDTISLRVFQEPEFSSEALQIDPAGNIDVPLLGVVQARGYSPSQLSRHLEQALTRYIRKPQVSIALIESGQTIIVEGAVNQPGVFPIRGRSSLVEALALAQSPTHVAANDQIFVFRDINGQRAGARFDIRRIRAGVDPDPLLLPGDQVVVGFSAVKEAWREYLGAPIFNLFRVIGLP